MAAMRSHPLRQQGRRWWLLGCVALVALATGCGAGAGSDSSGPIKIGLIQPLSGNSSDYGRPSVNGAQMRVEELNADGGINGRQLELVPIDDKLDPTTAVSAARQLVSRDGVVAIVGPGTSGNALAVEQFTNAQQVPTIVTAAVDRIVGPSFPYIWQATVPVSRQFAYLNDQVVEEYDRIALIHDSLGYGQEADKLVVGDLERRGVTPVADKSYDAGARDLTPQMLQIKRARPDVVLWFGSGGADAATVRQTMVRLGMKEVPMIGNNGLFSSALEIAGDSLNGYRYPDTVDPCKPAWQALERKYLRRYKQAAVGAPHAVAEFYDAVSVVAKGLEQTGGEGGQALNDALESGVEVDGAAGASPGMSFSADKHAGLDESQLKMWTVDDGRFAGLEQCR